MLTSAQNASLQPVIQAAAALSIVGSLAIIATYLGVPSFRRPSNRLVFWVSIADLFASICMFLAAWPINTFKVQTICTIQGWGITFFLLSAMFWTACLSVQCLLAIRKGTKLDKLVQLERYFHVVSWGIPFILATVAIFLGNDKTGPVYTDATLWCWIGSNYQGLRFYLFYMWLWGIFIWNLFVYGFVGFTLWRTQRKLAQYGKDSQNEEPWQPSRSMRIYVRKTSFFIVAFFINWFPGSLNRIQNMADPLNPVYALFLLHSIFTPLQGFLNFIAYFLVHYLFKGTNGQQLETADTSDDSAMSPNVAYVNHHDAVQYTNQDVSQYNASSKQTGPDYTNSDVKSSYGAATTTSSEPIYTTSYSVYPQARTQTVDSSNATGPYYQSAFQQQQQQQQTFQQQTFQQPMTQYHPANATVPQMFSPTYQPAPEPVQPNYASAAQFNYGSPQYGK